ncbi:MAG: S9 family peptidase [Calditrichaeota bacterium]|nr:S9 family peptidase [Calditrichota bacterium]
MNTGYAESAAELPLEEFFKTYRVGSMSFSPDETRFVFVSDKYGHSQPYMMPVRGGEWTPLLETDDAIYKITWCPVNGDLIFYIMDTNGDENFRLYRHTLSTKESEALSKTGARADFLGWSHNGFYLYFSTNERKPEFMDTYRLDVRTGKKELVFENNSTLSVTGVSPDDETLILSQFVNVLSSNLFVYDVRSKHMTAITSQDDGEANYEFADFSPDGKKLYIVTDKDSEFFRLVSYDTEEQEWDVELEEDWDVVGASFSHKNTYFVTRVNEDGITRVQIENVKTGEELELPPLPPAEIVPVGFSRSERYLRIYVNADNIPGDQYLYDLETFELIKLTNLFDTSQLRSEMLVKSDLVRYESFDGMEIPAWIYRPQKMSWGKRAPVVIEVHGGPMAQAKPSYSPWIQYLVSRGFIVAVPNVRGSTGYGKSFYLADDQRWGEDPLWDVVELKRYIADEYPEADTSKTVIWGGSYGGYMTLAAMTFTPEEFALGMDWVGPSNLFTLLESVPPYWRPYQTYFHQEIGNPDSPEDSARMYRQSPVNFADRIVRPLLIVQGRHDPRVKVAESEQIVDAARKNGKQVEYMIFEDEGHGLRKRDNKLQAYHAMYDFMIANLGMKRTD